MATKKRPSGVRKPSIRETITRLEKLIAELELQLPDADLRKAGSIERQLRIHRESLKIAKLNLISKINSVRHSVVPGSFGSSS